MWIDPAELRASMRLIAGSGAVLLVLVLVLLVLRAPWTVQRPKLVTGQSGAAPPAAMRRVTKSPSSAATASSIGGASNDRNVSCQTR